MRRREGGAGPNNLREGGGATYPLPPPNNAPTMFFNFYEKCIKLKGKIIINVILI